ncbi:hypothetical protein BSU04_45735 [Caballeronia sordidicola]|uniref:Uncharacterized protein n=1 Tax=Caballeronia sordidicola TaxID=196367 RepID=A0A226WM85_CABSO|nr:hypothetical protein BSU04_45735 [Caballeronia sordidicola]
MRRGRLRHDEGDERHQNAKVFVQVVLEVIHFDPERRLGASERLFPESIDLA